MAAKKKSKKMSAAATAQLLAKAGKTFGKKAKPFVSRMATSTASALLGGVSKAGVRRGSKRKLTNKGGTNQIPLAILKKRLASLEKTVRDRSGVIGKDDSKDLYSSFK